ncbi:MAG: nuclear transport factor 2 family protein [Xanthobacteraceae bacterium]|jgi:hypothetical protein
MQRRKSAKSAALRRIRHWGWLLALAAVVLIAAFAAPKAQPKAQAVAADDGPVLAADSSLGEAMRAGDRAAARRLLSLQFIFVDAGGKVHGRKDFLGELKGVAAAATDDAKARSYGQLAMVTGHRKAANNDDVFFLDIWARQKGTWRALLLQNVATAATAAAEPLPAAPAAAGGEPKQHECKNPCVAIPYRVRSPAEQDIIDTYQAIGKAIVAHDAAEWAKHVADEFALYGSGRVPVAKSGRIAAIERQKESNAAVAVGEIQTMRLSVYGDGAAMITTETAPDNSHPPHRAARVWVKRNGQWLMAISAHTEVK